MNKVIQEAIDICGGTQREFGKRIGLTQPAVNYLLHHAKRISHKHVQKIVKATRGKIPAYRIRPDLFKRPKRR